MSLILLILVSVHSISGAILWHPDFHAGIVNDTAHLCHGAIITDYDIIAPSSCLSKYKNSKLRIRSITPDHDVRFDDIVGVCLNDEYKFESNGNHINDIAVARISKPFAGSELHVPMFEKGQNVEEGTIAEIGTVGQFVDNEGVEPQVLPVKMRSNTQCNEAYAKMGGLSSGQFCAELPLDGPCDEEEGTALTIDGHLAGISSHWINSCDSVTKKPAAFTKIAYYRDFIDKCRQAFKDKHKRGDFDGSPSIGANTISFKTDGSEKVCDPVALWWFPIPRKGC